MFLFYILYHVFTIGITSSLKDLIFRIDNFYTNEFGANSIRPEKNRISEE